LEIDLDIRDLIVRLECAFHAARIEVRLYGRRINVLEDGWRNYLVIECAHAAELVDSGAQPIHHGRPVDIVLYVLFAGPDDFGRPPDSLRYKRGLHREIGHEPAAEAAAGVSSVHADLLFRQPQHLSEHEL